jgi:branched-chain amino acid transport system permease protein
LSGLAAALFTHSMVGSASPSQLLVLAVNVELIIAAIIGGMGNVGGAAFGGMVFYLAREWLSGISYTMPVFGLSFSEIYIMLFYVLVVVVLLGLPKGIYVSVIDRSSVSALESILDNWREFFASLRD